MSRGCNIGDGEVIRKCLSRMEVPWLSFNTIRGRVDFRQVEPRGDGGEVEEKLLFFEFINNKNVI